MSIDYDDAPINWKNAMVRPQSLFPPLPDFLLFLYLFFPLSRGVSLHLPSRILPRPFTFSLSRFLSHYENCHERWRHERRGTERGHYTRSLCQGLAVRHTVSRPPFSPTSFCVDRRHCPV